ncbi:MAG TPA: helix-hairpin-helix domain-containing protein [Candidatus Acidoferrales bacterium]|nr:helix-hairpin-helix domain-containing protein [Candidatus Acidoferrales bacterium]
MGRHSRRGEQNGRSRRISLRLPLLGVCFCLCCALLLAAPAIAKKHPPAQPLDINLATAEQLQQVPGIGPKTAEAIVHMRETSGPFRRVDDLLAIHGIGKKKYRMMRPYLTVRLPAAPKKGNPPQKPASMGS